MQIKNKIVTVLAITLLVTGLLHITMNIVPVVFSDPGETRREFWQVINVTNPMAYTTVVDINITLNSRDGVYIAASTGVTAYFNNSDYWQGLGYTSYMDWLNGTSSLPYHWGEMDWVVSNGSLTSITYDEIQHWGEMYFDSGGGVSYTTFMGSTYMADWNLTNPYNDPDIVSQVYWKGNEIKIIDDMIVPNGTTMYVVLKIVLTKSGNYNFNVTHTPGVAVSPASWIMGGVNTFLVPYDYPTIQAAINAASSGSTIVVYSGRYVEDLVIPATKVNLEIKSDESASVTIKGVQNVPVALWPLARPNIEINASGVKIHGFIIEGPDYASGYYSSGIVIGASDVKIYNNTFKVTPAAIIDEISQAIQTYHKNAVPGVNVSGLMIYNNTFTHLGSGSAGYEGVYINLDEGVGTAIVQYNQFIGNVVRAVTTERSSITISNNIIITDLAPGLPGGYQGINIGGANSGNVSNVLVINNTISGFQYGIKLGYSSTSVLSNVSVKGNIININDVGVWVRFSAGGVEVVWNNIFNNTNYGVQNSAAETLNAAYNWWGHETGPRHSANPYGGSGDNVSDNVVFEPWLIKPYPPLTPISVVHVNPNLVSLETPAVGKQFTVNVTIANVTMLYGFQFTLKWNSSLLTLMNPTNAHKIPTVWGSNYISQYNYSLTGGNYTLFASARSPAPPFNGTTTVASLTFKSIYDPIYPQNVTCSLSLENVIISDTNATQILRLVYSGTYLCNSAKPKLLFESKEYAAKQVPTEFDAYINVTNVMNLTAFYFKLTFNNTLLRVPSPAYVEILLHGANETRGLGDDYIVFNVTGIPPVNGSVRLARVRFMVNGTVWNIQIRNVSCSLAFVEHELSGATGVIDHEAIDGKYIYKPVPGDLDMNGVVDIIDLSAAAKAFGVDSTDPRWSMYSFADLNLDNVINVLDIVMVARNFGRTEPEP